MGGGGANAAAFGSGGGSGKNSPVSGSYRLFVTGTQPSMPSGTGGDGTGANMLQNSWYNKTSGGIAQDYDRI